MNIKFSEVIAVLFSISGLIYIIYGRITNPSLINLGAIFGILQLFLVLNLLANIRIEKLEKKLEKKLKILYFKNLRIFTTIGKPNPPKKNVKITTNCKK